VSEKVDHWDQVYALKAADEVSWYQSGAGLSIELIDKHATPGPLIDVGAGASVLVDHLLAAGRTDVTLLDVSAEGLEETRRRLGDAASAVTFVVADLLTWRPLRQFAIWHDRAVFHFLTDPIDRDAYVRTVAAALAPQGVMVLGTFAADGPDQCSGLPTARYDAASLAALFSGSFSVETSTRELHRTPWGGEQPFTWLVLRRNSDT